MGIPKKAAKDEQELLTEVREIVDMKMINAPI